MEGGEFYLSPKFVQLKIYYLGILFRYLVLSVVEQWLTSKTICKGSIGFISSKSIKACTILLKKLFSMLSVIIDKFN